MIIKKKVSNILYPTLFVFVYLVSMFFYISYCCHNDMLISLNKITSLNFETKILFDITSGLLPVIVLLIITVFKKRQIKDLGITLKKPAIIAALLLIYLLMFFANGDFTMKGFYEAYYYLIIVALSEELIFRGYLYSLIEREAGFWVAVVISGMLFGAAHSIMPAIMNDYTLLEFIRSIYSNLLGQGIFISGVFALLYKKSNTLFVPILIHAILDYMNVLFSK